MGSLSTILRHPDEIYPLLRLKLAIMKAQNQIPLDDPHLAVCYSLLQKVSRSFSLVIQQLGTELRDAVCVFYLILRALDTVEDDTSIPIEIKVPILLAFHRHIYDRDWHFTCGTKEYKVLMDQFHHVSAAFLELEEGYQEAIEDITKRMGAGMAKFISKEVETVDDYDEYCHYAAGLVGLGLSKLLLTSGLETLTPDWQQISNSTGLFLQKTNIIKDYLEDINEIPKPRMFWPKQPRDRDGDRKLGRERGRETSNLKLVDTETFPERLLLCPSPYPTILDVPGSPHTYWGRFLCVPETSPSPRRTRYVRRHQVGVPVQPRFWPREIWGKYVDKLEDLKNEEKSTKAVQCLNEMVTNALIHVEDCLKSMAGLRDPAIFKSCAIPQIVAMGTLALCYNNVQVFRGAVKLRRGLIAKVIDRTKTMGDVYGAFYDFSCMLKTKVDKNDPNAMKTLQRLETIEKVCRENGDLHKRKSYVNDETQSKALLFLMLVPLLAILVLAYLKHTHINASD